MANAILLFGLALLLTLGSGVEGQTCSTCQSCCYYVLTYSWIQTTCRMEDKSQSTSNTKECKPQAQLPTDITIHGLWPNLVDSTTQLGYCTDQAEKFNATLLNPIKPQLQAMWPTAFTGSGQSDESFWKHEWDKHGTCSRLGHFNYFQRSLDLDARYPVNKWLAASNIVPSNSRIYSLSQVKSAFTRFIKDDQFVLKCVSIKGGIQLLKDIMLCVSSADAQTLVTCSSVKATCNGMFYILQDFKAPIA